MGWRCSNKIYPTVEMVAIQNVKEALERVIKKDVKYKLRYYNHKKYYALKK